MNAQSARHGARPGPTLAEWGTRSSRSFPAAESARNDPRPASRAYKCAKKAHLVHLHNYIRGVVMNSMKYKVLSDKRNIIFLPYVFGKAKSQRDRLTLHQPIRLRPQRCIQRCISQKAIYNFWGAVPPHPTTAQQPYCCCIIPGTSYRTIFLI